MELNQIYTQILTEHNNSNRNKHHIENPTVTLKGVNPSCGDEITLELREKDGVIEDAGFTGIGCAISQASASIMIDLIKGKTTEEALKLAKTFFGMIKNEITDEKRAGSARRSRRAAGYFAYARAREVRRARLAHA